MRFVFANISGQGKVRSEVQVTDRVAKVKPQSTVKTELKAFRGTFKCVYKNKTHLWLAALQYRLAPSPWRLLTTRAGAREAINRFIYSLSGESSVRAHAKRKHKTHRYTVARRLRFFLEQWIWKIPAALSWQPTIHSRLQGYIWWTKAMQHLCLQDMLFSAGKFSFRNFGAHVRE